MILQEQYAHTSTASIKSSSPESRLIGCPICGRPIKIRRQLIGQEVACSHCHGTFVVSDQIDGSQTSRSAKAVRQAEERQVPHRSTPLVPSHERNGLLRPNRHERSDSRHVAHVVRPSDEVYSSLAADLLAAGYRVVRDSPASTPRPDSSPASAGNETSLKRLFLHPEEFEFFKDSFAYQRRVSTAASEASDLLAKSATVAASNCRS